MKSRSSTPEDTKYWVALDKVSGLGPKKFDALERAFESMEAVWSAAPSELSDAGLDLATATKIVRERDAIYPDDEIKKLEDSGVRAIPRTSTLYPTRLGQIYDPPAVIYVRGALTEADGRSVAVIGTRKPTTHGKEACYLLAGELARNGVTVVSGLARGIDGIAHNAALEAGGRTLAVLGSGLDRIYPGEHMDLARRIPDAGALISEFPLGTRPDAHNFPRRNRILSALSLGTLVIEAGFKSGAMLTVEHAVQQNKEVFAVPGSILSETNKGTNWLIQQGAKLVTGVDDVLDELNIVVKGGQLPMEEIVLENDLEATVLGVIDAEPRHIDDVTRTTRLESSAVASTLSVLEIKGLVRQAGPMQYVRAREVRAVYEPSTAGSQEK
ncbi:MAG: DNA-protecting protein DprA [Chloroflexi bacterium]|nr:DNA-protecting protein DprA [Chloroflexota bacterium]